MYGQCSTTKFILTTTISLDKFVFEIILKHRLYSEQPKRSIFEIFREVPKPNEVNYLILFIDITVTEFKTENVKTKLKLSLKLCIYL